MTLPAFRAAALALLPQLFAAAALAAAVFVAPAQAQSSLPVDPEERAVLRSEIRKYLLENPEVIMEAIQILEQRREQAEAASEMSLVKDNAEALFEDGYSHVAGNPDGDVTVVEFVDYNCGYCKKAHEDVRKLVETDAGLRYVVKEFPILGPTSITAARAALAARAQEDGRLYMAFNDALMEHRGALTDDQVWEIADDVGLDVEKLKADAESDAVAEAIKSTYELARAMNIQGTPTFVIGGALVRGFVPLEKLRETVAEERGKQG